MNDYESTNTLQKSLGFNKSLHSLECIISHSLTEKCFDIILLSVPYISLMHPIAELLRLFNLVFFSCWKQQVQ